VLPRRFGLFVLVFAVCYVSDVLSKIVAVHRLEPGHSVEIVGDFFTLYLIRNPGAAFSMGERFTVFLSCLAVVATVVAWRFAWLTRHRGWAVGIGLVGAGVLGNLTDRLLREPGPMRGHVVDFFRLPNWPIFNVADICINVGAGLILLLALRGISYDGTREESAGSAKEGDA
jgi:signal peptidase II